MVSDKEIFRFVLGAAILLLGLIAAPAFAQGEGTILRVEPETIQVGAGQIEIIALEIENGKEIYGIDVRAEFDANAIEIVDADPNEEGIQMAVGDFIKPDFLVRNEADNAAGTLQYIVTQTNPTLPANGGGTVLQIAVRGKAQGKTSPFKINFVEIADRRGNPLEIIAHAGTVEVVAPKSETATPRVVAQISVTPTRQANTTAAPRTRTRQPAPSAARTTDDSNSDLVRNIVLLVLAVGGCMGALVVLGIGLVLVLRKPHTGRYET